MKRMVSSVSLTLGLLMVIGIICAWSVPIMVITGQVQDSDGTLLENVEVIIKNTNKVTQNSQRTLAGDEAGTFDFTLID